jgi:hypothetical protein
VARVVRSACRSLQIAKVVTYLLRFVCQWHVFDVLRAVERPGPIGLQRSKEGVEVLRGPSTFSDELKRFADGCVRAQASNQDLSDLAPRHGTVTGIAGPPRVTLQQHESEFSGLVVIEPSGPHDRVQMTAGPY